MEKATETKEKPVPGKSLPFWAIALTWLVLAFAVPYGLTFKLASNPYSPGVQIKEEPSRRTLEDATQEAIRSGVMGCLVALIILSLWKVDRAFFAGKEPDLENSVRMKVVVTILAFALWIIWTSSGYIMIKANDEISNLGTSLPGMRVE